MPKTAYTGRFFNFVSALILSLRTKKRSNRDGIEVLRADYAVLNRDDGKGYYLPEETDSGRADTKRWHERQERRVQAIRASQAGALKFIGMGRREPKGVYGQLSMFRDGG